MSKETFSEFYLIPSVTLNLTSSFIKSKSQAGIAGNEYADALAKYQAATAIASQLIQQSALQALVAIIPSLIQPG
jgi:hypothetical protein